MSLLKELREKCNLIVGHWYCDKIQQQFIFDFNANTLRENKLVVINSKETFETEYGLAIRPSHDTDHTPFYFDIGRFEKRYYEVVELTKDKLVVREFYMKPDTPPSPHILTYVRKIDLTGIDEILKGID